MNTNSAIPVNDPTSLTQEEWFEIIIHRVSETFPLHVEESELEEAMKEAVAWFKSLLDESSMQEDPASQERFKNAFVQVMTVLSYLLIIRSEKLNLLKLAMYPASDKIYVWAEINDEDEETEEELLDIEAKINAIDHAEACMSLETIIVEKRYSLAIPDNYKYEF